MNESAKEFVKQRMNAMRRQFGDTIPERLQEIIQAWEKWSGDDAEEQGLEVLHRLLHTLAGSAGTFGFIDLGKEAREIESELNALREWDKPASPTEKQAILTQLMALKSSLVNDGDINPDLEIAS